MASVVDICNLALAHLGDEATVSSIDPHEGSPQAGYCALFYPVVRDALLTKYTWSFATRRANLALLADTSPAGWEFVYALPNNCIKPLAVLAPTDNVDAYLASLIGEDVDSLFSKGHPDNDHQQFATEALSSGTKVIYSNIEDAILVYIHRTTDTTQYTPLMVLAFARLLAAYLAGPVIKGESGAKAGLEHMKIFAQMEFKAATTDDTQSRQQSVYADVTPSSIAVRG